MPFRTSNAPGGRRSRLASALLEDAGVALIGGPDFGVLGEGYIRLSYANSEENIAIDGLLDHLAVNWRIGAASG